MMRTNPTIRMAWAVVAHAKAHHDHAEVAAARRVLTSFMCPRWDDHATLDDVMTITSYYNEIMGD